MWSVFLEFICRRWKFHWSYTKDNVIVFKKKERIVQVSEHITCWTRKHATHFTLASLQARYWTTNQNTLAIQRHLRGVGELTRPSWQWTVECPYKYWSDGWQISMYYTLFKMTANFNWQWRNSSSLIPPICIHYIL